MHNVLKTGIKKKCNQEMKRISVGQIDLEILANSNESDSVTYSIEDNTQTISPSDFSPTEEDIAEVIIPSFKKYNIRK